MFVFFRQKTAYDMRISDWSSDVCSSDLLHLRLYCGADRWPAARRRAAAGIGAAADRAGRDLRGRRGTRSRTGPGCRRSAIDRKRVGSGKSVSVRVDLGGGRIIKKKTNIQNEPRQYRIHKYR